MGNVKGKASRPYHHGDLPRVLREGALTLIEELGWRGFTLRELARRVGVSHAAPYRHYADRGALLTALAVEGSTRLAEALEAALTAAGPDFRARYLAAGHAYVRFAVDHPGYFQAMFSTEVDKSDPAMVVARDRSFGLLLSYIGEAQAAGYFGAGDPMSYALPTFAMHQGLAELAATGAFAALGASDVRAVSDLAHGRLLDGLAPLPRERARGVEKRKRAPRKSA